MSLEEDSLVRRIASGMVTPKITRAQLRMTQILNMVMEIQKVDSHFISSYRVFILDNRCSHFLKKDVPS